MNNIDFKTKEKFSFFENFYIEKLYSLLLFTLLLVYIENFRNLVNFSC